MYPSPIVPSVMYLVESIVESPDSFDMDMISFSSFHYLYFVFLFCCSLCGVRGLGDVVFFVIITLGFINIQSFADSICLHWKI